MSLEEKLLIVVDPTADNHPAIARAIELVHVLPPDHKQAATVLFIVDQSALDDNDKGTGYRDDQFLHNLVEPLRVAGIDTTLHLSWSKNWALSIIASADSAGATTIMVPHPGDKVSRHLSDELWYLLRNAPVPVAVIPSTAKPSKKAVLIAMDVQDKALEGLNKRILDAGTLAAQMHGAELHLANAYGSSSSYPDRARLAAITGLSNENIHIRSGDPDQALGEIAQEVEPVLIVIGATRRTGIKAALRGQKITKILKNAGRDVFVVN